jgi:hypothetical protein
MRILEALLLVAIVKDHEHNDLMLNALGTSVVQIDSKDYKPEYPDKAIDLSSIPEMKAITFLYPT